MSARTVSSRTEAHPPRVATYTYGRDPAAIRRQERRLRVFLTARAGWRLTARYRDIGPERHSRQPQLQQALTDARDGRFDVLLVDTLDRFTRDLHQLATVLNALDRAGVTLRAATEPVNTATPLGRILTRLAAALTEPDRPAVPLRPPARRGRHATTNHRPRRPPPYRRRRPRS